MYFYYMLAAMGPQYRKYLWWKKYITWIQLIQFTIMLSYLTLIVYLDCKLHRALTIFFMINVSIFLYLFSSFYINAYSKNMKLKAEVETSAPLEVSTNLIPVVDRNRSTIQKLIECDDNESHDVYVGSLTGNKKKSQKIE